MYVIKKIGLLVLLASTIALPSNASFPGRNGLIVFDGSEVDTASGCAYINPHDIYTMEPDGTGIKNLTDSEGYDTDPSWSPDGRRIAFVREDESADTFSIVTMRSDGTHQRAIVTSSVAADLRPTWSDHGFWIAYRHTTDTEQDIHRVRSDGSRDEAVIATRYSESLPSYSPDGERIAYITDRGEEGYDIWTIRPDGTRPKQLTEGLSYRRTRPRGYGGYYSLGWSPDGRWLLFSMNKGEGDTYIYKLRRNGRGLDRLAAGRETVWSPNGRSILYEGAGGNGCTPELYRMRPDGSSKKRLPKRDDFQMYNFNWQAR